MAITSSPPIGWHTVDLSSADWDFLAMTGRKGRALRVVVPTGTANPQVTFREDGVSADLAMVLAAGQIEIIPGDFTHVRRTGTTSGITIYGAV